jgi:hypothetical protein
VAVAVAAGRFTRWQIACVAHGQPWWRRESIVVSQWCYSGVTVALQWCYSGVTVALQWRYSGVTVVVVLLRYYRIITYYNDGVNVW